ncbi:MAG: XRE family transcriptional regulator [Clostridia bacterium]|nr:XRE family transcriptional regulator [Clostridia bacterium]
MEKAKVPCSERIKEALAMREMIQSELATATGLGRNAISQYVSGKFEPKQTALYKIAKVLDVSEAWLMGYDVPKERLENLKFSSSSAEILSIRVQKIPMLGEIACGEPIFCNEERESYVAIGAEIKADFCLKCKGDSMIGARIYDGDIVFISSQSIVDNGEIAAVIIGDEVTLKRVFYYPDKLVLQAENPKYQPFVYVGEELNSIRILGKAIAFQSDVI